MVEELLTRQELMKFLKIKSNQTVYNWEREGRIPKSIFVGSKRLWRKSDLEEYIKSL